MVAMIDEEFEKLENNSEYLKLQMIRLERIMKNECVGDMERQPYKQEYNRIKKKLELLKGKRYYIWHNTRGIADEYFIVDKETDKVVPRWFGCIWRVPKFIGRMICRD